MCCLTKETVLSYVSIVYFFMLIAFKHSLVLTLEFFFVMKVVHELDSPKSDH